MFYETIKVKEKMYMTEFQIKKNLLIGRIPHFIIVQNKTLLYTTIQKDNLKGKMYV